MTGTGSLLRSLECRSCGGIFPPDRPTSTCPNCHHTLLAHYALDRLDGPAWIRAVAERPGTIWRYRELLPVQDLGSVTTLGEGGSPLLGLGTVPGAEDVRVSAKDDGLLPTGSFKARGMAMAVSRARELGIRSLFVPSAGNAGVAMAAYSARAGLSARVYLPERTPRPMKEAVRRYGAQVVEVAGTIREAGERARADEKDRGSFDMSTLREPYRVEGKKTMGFEIFEQSRATGLPDAIVYPAGGGTGLIGMAKAFAELAELGLLEVPPRLVAVQPEGCAPIVRALREDASAVTPWADPRTIAPGLLVPAPFSAERILEAIRSTKGTGITVTDREIVDAMADLSTRHGLSASPEAAAPYAALPKLRAAGAIRSDEAVWLYQTGTGIPFSIDELDRTVGRTLPT